MTDIRLHFYARILDSLRAVVLGQKHLNHAICAHLKTSRMRYIQTVCTRRVCVGSRTETAVAVGATTVYHLRRLDLVRNTTTDISLRFSYILEGAHMHG